jgi:light-regulated signal transduction histidine kinase (bacteriophytochrome)
VTQAELNIRRLDLSGMAHKICDELAAGEPERQVDVQVEDGLTAEGDSLLVEQLLQNLIGNAWKFTRNTDAARIAVGTLDRSVDGVPVFFVRDNGAGFDMKHAPKLFIPFRRLHSDTEFKGTGIGLATVQRSAALHGGTVWAEAEVDKGAAFYFTLAPTEETPDDR